MNFKSYPHPSNFTFAESPPLDVATPEDGVCVVEWVSENSSQCVSDLAGLQSSSRGFFGRCGEASMFCFSRQPDDRFYGLGEKWTGLEHSGRGFRFWNTDVWADFHGEQYVDFNPPPDPVYVSIPYLIIKRENRFIGILLDTVRPAAISTGSQISIAGQMDVEGSDGEFWLEVDSGPAKLVLFEGPTLAEVTRRFQCYVGTTPLPPAWALGYHQCRWGYESEADLKALDEKMSDHGIPCDGLWLDIDYMDGYRVFTLAQNYFPTPEKTLAQLTEHGRRIVPIIDPGVKKDSSYGVYQRGQSADAFCQNPGGGEFVGLVWPGETVFPDFSLPEVKSWWANEVSAFVQKGFGGAWLDMNDPATGPVDNEDMLFDHGQKPHAHYHNAYALGMGEATRKGFLQARPAERPFLLSRSGCTRSQAYTAIWTGDNFSNYKHLKSSISTTLNLSLSGIPFNAPDVGGFGGDTYEQLMCDWYKACFLFPVLRNHSVINTRDQEPWAFDDQTLEVVRKFIRLRYRLRPYLYQLFVEHHRTGEAILRPLFYDFPEDGRFDFTDDAFLVGPNLLQAPFVEEGVTIRQVDLPSGQDWFDVFSGVWLSGGASLQVAATDSGTPLYVRDGSILPLARLQPGEHQFDGARVDLHIFMNKASSASTRYVFDDGLSLDQSNYSELELVMTLRNGTLHMESTLLTSEYGEGDFCFSVLSKIEHVVLNDVELNEIPRIGVDFGVASWRSFASG